jgi:DNA polymerase (family 10)
MAMDNEGVAAFFYEIADLLELQGVAFKPIAYRKAAGSIEQLDEPIEKVAAENRLQDIPGVGESVAKKIEEILKTGKLAYIEKLRTEVPASLKELVSIPDVGPKTAMILYKDLGIKNMDDLKKAAIEHRLHALKGFGEKTEERILQGIRTVEARAGRMLLGEAYPVGMAFVEYLESKSLDLVSLGGSLRRGKETIGDIDILVGSDDSERASEMFVSHPEVDEVVMRGPTKSSVRLRNGLQVDLRVLPKKNWGAALQYFTGSKEHNVALRSIGIKKGFKLNEYAVADRKTGMVIASETEEEVYNAFGLPVMPPEIRENAGELEAAKEGKLPKLVEEKNIRGDLHIHTNWSDGSSTLKEVVAAAVDRRYEYVCISDHSQSLKIANGLSPERVKKQIALVRRADEESRGEIQLLMGSEVDIMKDGLLDFPTGVLKSLDVVIGSVHSNFRMSKSEMTRRLITAMESGYMDILGHPTGRVIGQRDPYDVDLEQVLDAAKRTGVCMELNCYPDRLDLRDVHCRAAKDAGVTVAIGTDSHNVKHMDNMRYGVITARRGWLEDRNVLNTRPVKEILKGLHGSRT